MITINLMKDLADAICAELAALGFDTSKISEDSEKAMKAWFRASRYMVIPSKRSVLKALDFSTLGEDQGLKILEEKIRKGDDLNTHLSSRIADPTKPDGLLDHWSIKHFHLGETIDIQTGRIERTKNVLLCRIDENNVYFIKVVPHGLGVDEPWYEKELLEIIHKNWPESIEFAKARDVESVSPQVESKEDIKALRHANLVTMMTMQDGTVYVPPGFGTTGDGTNPLDLLEISRIIRSATEVEDRVKRDYIAIRDDARKLGYHFKDDALFILAGYAHNFLWDILETETGYRFRVYP